MTDYKARVAEFATQYKDVVTQIGKVIVGQKQVVADLLAKRCWCKRWATSFN